MTEHNELRGTQQLMEAAFAMYERRQAAAEGIAALRSPENGLRSNRSLKGSLNTPTG